MVHPTRQNLKKVKWAVTLMEMGFDVQKIEATIPGCKSIEECLNALCGRSGDEDSSEPPVQAAVETVEEDSEQQPASSAGHTAQVVDVAASQQPAHDTSKDSNAVWQQAAEQWRLNVARLQQKIAERAAPVVQQKAASSLMQPSAPEVKQLDSTSAPRMLTTANVASLQRRLSNPEDLAYSKAKSAKLTTENVATLQRRLSEPEDPPIAITRRHMQMQQVSMNLAAASRAAASTTSSVCSAEASISRNPEGSAPGARRRIRCKKSDEQPPAKMMRFRKGGALATVQESCVLRSSTAPLSPLCSTSTASPEESGSPSPVTAVLSAAASSTAGPAVLIAPQSQLLAESSPGVSKPGMGHSSKLGDLSPRLLLMPTPQRRSGRRESMDSCKSNKSDDSDRGAFQWSQFRAFATSSTS